MRAFIGIGPGRCGTMSLSRIVRACKNCHVSHEMFPSPWYETSPNLGKFILGCKRGIHPGAPGAAPGGLVGEVSCNLMPHIQKLREPLPDLKIVCLHRNKDDVVRSFIRWGSASFLRPADREVRARELESTNFYVAVNRFPVIDAASAEQAWGFYWEMCEEIMSKVKQPVFHMQTSSLKDDFTLRLLFEFLDIPSHDMVFSDRRVWNSTEERFRAKCGGSRTKSERCS